MPPAESRVKMNGFAAPDTAAVICSAAIKRGFAAPSPGFPAHNFIFSESNLRKILDSTTVGYFSSFIFIIILLLSIFVNRTDNISGAVTVGHRYRKNSAPQIKCGENISIFFFHEIQCMSDCHSQVHAVLNMILM